MNRRYDIDWIRVIAIGLLLIYHVAIGVQPWGIMIGFITNDKPWSELWIPMAMLNIWRIPLLFFVSGMGVYFAMQQRTLKQLIAERAARIFVPYVFGMIAIFPLCVYIWQNYYSFNLSYSINPGHLWFLGNIFAYVLIFAPLFFYLKKDANGKVVRTIKAIFSNPAGLLLVVGAFILEVILVKPMPFELYAMTWHGFYLGMTAFFFGFCFVLSGNEFWNMLLRWRWMFLVFAVGLFVYRIMQFQMRVPNYLLVIESLSWIFSVFAFGFKYLNHPGKTLRYLSEAAYPVYIIHMVFLFLVSALIFPLAVSAQVKFFIVLIITVGCCFGFYELVRRVNFLRPLFGLKKNHDEIRSVKANQNLHTTNPQLKNLW